MKRSTSQQRLLRDQLNELYRQQLDNTNRTEDIKIKGKITRLRTKLARVDPREEGSIGSKVPHLVGYCMSCEKPVLVGDCYVEWRSAIFCNSEHLHSYLIDSGHKNRPRVEA